jgi:FMN phosphatase YigB (HAD superfamily)
LTTIDAVIFDYGFTISSEYYFNVPHPRIPRWRELIQESVFADQRVIYEWMKGRISLGDVAGILQKMTGEDSESILAYLRDGCRNLKENKAVIEFAKQLRENSISIGLVTANFDVFNEVIVPEHRYNELFDVIINSCDYGEINKRVLWPIAFDKLGKHIEYGNSLLVEDGKKEPQLFIDAGGHAIEYVDDMTFMMKTKRFTIVNNYLQRTA